MSKAQAAFQSEAHKLYGFNYSLTYKNNFVPTCISPTLLNKNKKKRTNFKHFQAILTGMHCYFSSSKSKGIFTSLRMPIILFNDVLKGKAIKQKKE